MSYNHHGFILFNFMHQLHKMRVDESIHSNSHRLLALHIDKTGLVAVSFQMCILPRLVALPRPLKEFFPFVEAEVLLSQELELCGLGPSRILSFADSLSCDESSLEVGGE